MSSQTSTQAPSQKSVYEGPEIRVGDILVLAQTTWLLVVNDIDSFDLRDDAWVFSTSPKGSEPLLPHGTLLLVLASRKTGLALNGRVFFVMSFGSPPVFGWATGFEVTRF